MDNHSSSYNLPKLLTHLKNGGKADKNQIKFLLSLSNIDDIEGLFEAARFVRENHFGNGIFLYGFLYFSTFCRNSCRFCQYRASNHMAPRYRKTESEILSAAREMADTGVHLIDLTMGEDPELLSSGKAGFEHLTNLCSKIHKETHTQSLYNRLRSGQNFETRMVAKRIARKLGMLIEEGILTGVGETVADLALSIEMMAALDADQVRVMTFVPQKGTPMGNLPSTDNFRERIVIAVMRLLFPDRLIPASLDVDGLDGLKQRLDSGASVITSIVPPQKGLAGVANDSLDIDNARRAHDSIIPILDACNLTVAEQKKYLEWIQKRRKNKTNGLPTKNVDVIQPIGLNAFTPDDRNRDTIEYTLVDWGRQISTNPGTRIGIMSE